MISICHAANKCLDSTTRKCMSAYQRRFVHVVARGETLDAIARTHYCGSWKELYLARCNVELRRKRSKPDLIQPGDEAGIPAEPGWSCKPALRDSNRYRRTGISAKLLDELNADSRRLRRSKTGPMLRHRSSGCGRTRFSIVYKGCESLSLTGTTLAECRL